MQHDQDIIANIRRGDKQAYRLLVERYQQKVFQTCMGFVHHEEDAADLTQEVFIKVYEKLDAFRGEAAFSTWLYRMAVNHSLNAVRKNKLKAYFRGNDGSDVPDRKSTRLNSSHVRISYAVFCLKKKKNNNKR